MKGNSKEIVNPVYRTRFLTCTTCHEEFVFTVEAQEEFAHNNRPDPKRCKTCHFEHKHAKRDRVSV